MPSPSARGTARRNLVWRIEEFLRKQTTPPSSLTAWQADQVLGAIEMLDAGMFAEGERTIMQVEKAAVFEPASYVPVNRNDVGQLRECLARVLKG